MGENEQLFELMAKLYEEMKEIKSEVNHIQMTLENEVKTDIKDIQMTLENETNKNIRLIAEGPQFGPKA